MLSGLPRRFGKSLLVSSLAAILRGQRELFKGLWIDGSDYDWKPNPIIRLSLDGIESESVERLESGLTRDIMAIAESESLSLLGSSPVELFQSLFEELYAKYNRKVAVLI
ncbi:MAG: AAA family ATPase, partial [Deltaproteobacteria bacterium]|nr:AAA family ATPase [Deltaproteobacteria bacterium]